MAAKYGVFICSCNRGGGGAKHAKGERQLLPNKFFIKEKKNISNIVNWFLLALWSKEIGEIVDYCGSHIIRG